MNTPARFRPQWWVFFVTILAVPSLAEAHVSVGGADGLVNGFVHPLGGPDHLLAMLGVGLWAAQRGGRSIWLVPLAFLGVMALGGALGMAGVALPLVEQGILASVLLVGILIAAAVELPLVASVLIVGLFALMHGHAHGAEMPSTASGLAYGAGFIASTCLLLASGVGLGLLARQLDRTYLLRYAGGAIAICGVLLLLSA
jgi:urease accessory protein